MEIISQRPRVPEDDDAIGGTLTQLVGYEIEGKEMTLKLNGKVIDPSDFFRMPFRGSELVVTYTDKAPVGPTGPTDPTDPVDPTGPTEPVGSTEPTGPSGPGGTGSGTGHGDAFRRVSSPERYSARDVIAGRSSGTGTNGGLTGFLTLSTYSSATKSPPHLHECGVWNYAVLCQVEVLLHAAMDYVP